MPAKLPQLATGFVKIEHNVPAPRKRVPWRELIGSMKDGDSILLSAKDAHSMLNASYLTGIKNLVSKKAGKDQTRVWKVPA